MAKPFWRVEGLDLSVGDKTQVVTFDVTAANNHGDIKYAPVDDQSSVRSAFDMAARFLRQKQQLQVKPSIISTLKFYKLSTLRVVKREPREIVLEL